MLCFIYRHYYWLHTSILSENTSWLNSLKPEHEFHIHFSTVTVMSVNPNTLDWSQFLLHIQRLTSTQFMLRSLQIWEKILLFSVNMSTIRNILVISLANNSQTALCVTQTNLQFRNMMLNSAAIGPHKTDRLLPTATKWACQSDIKSLAT